MSRQPYSRDTILAAAEAVVVRAGTGQLTLDAVAAAAGISKGGLLHRFPSKEALLEALVTRQIERHEATIQEVRATLPDTPGKELCAYILAAWRDAADTKRVCSAFLAAAANEPKLLAPVRADYRARLAEMAATATGGDLARAAVVCLATDGLWLMELMHISPLDPRERDAVIAELLRLAELQATPAKASPPPMPASHPTTPTAAPRRRNVDRSLSTVQPTS